MKNYADLIGDSIRIGPFDYEIIHTPTAMQHGETDMAGMIICIDKRLEKWRLFHTLKHEIIHNMDDAYCIHQPENWEVRADIYATAWTQVERDNKWYVKYISKVCT